VSSYGGVDFEAIEEGWSENATSAVNVRGFPGSNNIAVSLGGRREITRQVTCIFPGRGQYVNFVLLRGTVNGLTISNWDPDAVAAVLKDCNPDPPRSDGKVSAKATFILL
jgi:hypothetical protein